MPSLVLVVPFHDEAGRWSEEYWTRMLATAHVHWVLVDDGSSDGTLGLLRGRAREGVDVVVLERNRGKSEAVRAGLLHGLREHPGVTAVGFLDGDGAFDVEEVHRIAIDATRRLAAGGEDAVWTSRVALAGRWVERRPGRHYLGRLIATYLFRAEPWAPYDSQCGFKIFRGSEALRSAIAEPFHTRWFVDIELMTRLAAVAGAVPRIREEPLEHWRDIAGSKITGRQVPRLVREIRFTRHRIRRMARTTRSQKQ